ncbi:hypothetical protein HWV62_35592 [Athelia sp. TMB]|nr:hypothetical protein HWV62_35592 [Athelia sp. TMB]
MKYKHTETGQNAQGDAAALSLYPWRMLDPPGRPQLHFDALLHNATVSQLHSANDDLPRAASAPTHPARLTPSKHMNGDGGRSTAVYKTKVFVAQLRIPEKVNLMTGVNTSRCCVGDSSSVPRLGFAGFCLEAMGAKFRGKGVNVALGPMMNLARNGAGADPFLMGVHAAHNIVGMQSEGVIACAKHFALNEQEHYRGAGEGGGSFMESVRAGVGSMMRTFNRMNQTSACENRHLLNTVLKEELDFQGLKPADPVTANNSYWGAQLEQAVMNGSIAEIGQGKNYPMVNFGYSTENTEYEGQDLNEHVNVQGNRSVLIHKISAASPCATGMQPSAGFWGSLTKEKPEVELANSTSFDIVRHRSPPFATTVRHRSPPYAIVRHHFPSFVRHHSPPPSTTGLTSWPPCDVCSGYFHPLALASLAQRLTGARRHVACIMSTKTEHKAARQKVNRARWMGKPGVREEQNEKARIRAARRREQERLEKLVEAQRSPSGTRSRSRSLHHYSAPRARSPLQETSVQRSPQHMPSPFQRRSRSQSPRCISLQTGHCSGEHSQSRPLESDDDEDSEAGVGPMDDVAYHIRRLRVDHANWTQQMGAESIWDSSFTAQLLKASKDGKQDHFFRGILKHITAGRALLAQLKALGEAGLNSTPDEIRDLFMQGFDLITSTMAEVKFFELKLDQYAPIVPSSTISQIRFYDVPQTGNS